MINTSAPILAAWPVRDATWYHFCSFFFSTLFKKPLTPPPLTFGFRIWKIFFNMGEGGGRGVKVPYFLNYVNYDLGLKKPTFLVLTVSDINLGDFNNGPGDCNTGPRSIKSDIFLLPSL